MFIKYLIINKPTPHNSPHNSPKEENNIKNFKYSRAVNFLLSDEYKKLPPWTDDYTKFRPTLIDVEQNSYVFCSCEAPLFFNMMRSPYFSHWADNLAPIISLAEKILKGNEKIEEIKEIRFLKPIKNNVNVFVFEEGYEDENFKKEEASIIGKLSTSNGRILKFIVIQRNNDPIKDIRRANAINDTIEKNTKIEKIWDWSWQVNIENSNFEDMRKILEQNIILAHSVLVDSISVILADIFKENLLPEKMENQLALDLYLVKLENLPIKSNVFDLLSQWIEVKPITSKSISSDVIFYTFEIKTSSSEIINVTISCNRIF